MGPLAKALDSSGYASSKLTGTWQQEQQQQQQQEQQQEEGTVLLTVRLGPAWRSPRRRSEQSCGQQGSWTGS